MHPYVHRNERAASVRFCVGRAGSLATTEYQYQKIDMDLTDFCGHLNGESTIANKANRDAPELRRQMVELVRTGRTPSELSREFGPTRSTIAHWAKQAERDAGRSDRGLTTVEGEGSLARRV
jgi:hypothetical protein